MIFPFLIDLDSEEVKRFKIDIQSWIAQCKTGPFLWDPFLWEWFGRHWRHVLSTNVSTSAHFGTLRISSDVIRRIRLPKKSDGQLIGSIGAVGIDLADITGLAAELSRGSTCKWFRLVMFFQEKTEKGRKRKKMKRTDTKWEKMKRHENKWTWMKRNEQKKQIKRHQEMK